jgi:tRNA A-37 threonylcarbamoyl transferase component Bud32
MTQASPAELECPSCGRMNPPDAHFCAGCGFRFGGDDLLSGDTDGGADPLLGRLIAERYRIEELLGRGGMGVVYRVEHVRINKLMAMKLLHGALARDKDVVKRFKREAEAVSKLDHPNTVQVFDFGQSEGMMFLVMEYLSGRDLGQLIKDEGRLTFDRAARIAAQVAGSVAQAHERGIVHRDLKPENVMVVSGRSIPDFVKVLDFGLAKLREDEHGEKSITRAGSILGTPYYMAPEHIRGEDVDARSDVYAMGALLYKAITGVPPFWASTPVGVLTMHLTDDVVPPSERPGMEDLPEDADRIVMRAMQRDPRDRFQSMEQLRQELLAYLAMVGQDEGLESSRLARVSGKMATQSGRQRQVATRGDIDVYERQIRRRSLAGWAFVIAVIAAVIGGGGWWAWTQRDARPRGTESEPNNRIGDATPLDEDVVVTAYLGRRLDEQRSDADFYRLTSSTGERRTVRIEVSSIPNMDITFDLFREGISTPVLTADSGGIGAEEIVPNFVLDGRTYYLRVRELWESGSHPTENISDPYTVVWRIAEPEEGDEREVNDSLELAEPVRVGQTRRGYVGWAGDVDTYCLEADASDLVARIEPMPSLDLVLEVVDRATGNVRRFDDSPLGGGEITTPTAVARAGQWCVEVSARRPKEGLGNDANARYVLHLEHGQEEETPVVAPDAGVEEPPRRRPRARPPQPAAPADPPPAEQGQ